MAEKPRYSINLDDVNNDKVTEVVEHIERAKAIPLVREVGVNKGNRDGLITIAILVAAGLVAGVLTWAIWSVLPEFDDSFTANMVSSFSITLVIAISLAGADSAMSRSLAKLGRNMALAVPAALLLALLLGLLANSIYSALVEKTYQGLLDSGLSPYDQSFWDAFGAKNHLNRGIAWALLGLAAALSVGVPSKSLKRIGITGAGGFVGGFLGGFLFDFFTGATLAQVTGLMITGASVGLAVSLLEQVTKSSWLEIVRGGMAGKQFILYQSQITIGSSPAANITLIKDPSILPVAAVIKRFGGRVTISATDRAYPIAVNGVSGFDQVLSEGSLIVLGSTELRFREKSKKINDSKIIRG